MKNTFVKPTNYLKYVQHVIQWNSIATGGVHDHSPSNIERQVSFVKEEFQEMMEALANDDKVEYVDALADLVVTVGYWLYLKEPETITKNCTLNSFNFGANHIKALELAITNDEPYVALQEVMSLFYQAECLVDKIIWEVLDSNDSKYPALHKCLRSGEMVIYEGDCDFERSWTPERMCKIIETKYAGRYTGITYQVYDGKVIFKDDKGKIVKPLTFKNPKLKDFV